jgi:hypothetical protein
MEKKKKSADLFDYYSQYFSITNRHSIITATPLGSMASAIASAICRVKRSCTII